ncbi:MAG: SUF system NifU family Fe-S cluster assembly protein [Lachnospiraceae bacterium]|nr:SUF system NifU family Fe-S cluster assembly protein [Lachnospiraceae bacterium]
MSDTFYNEILTDHNIHPMHKHELPDANYTLEGVNPSCGDDIVLKLKVEDDVIVDGAYVGQGCAISQASADIMLDLIIGKNKEEALELADIFMRMIKEKISEEELERLEEAGALSNVSHMPARVKCAVLGWRTLNEMFTKEDE